MINRPVALGFPIVVLVAVLVAVFVAEFQPGLPQGARAALDRYVGYQHGRSGFRPVVREISPALRPHLFKAALSGDSYGDSPYYRTTRHYLEPADPAETAPGVSPMHFVGESGRPLPFPPERLWCVILDPGELEGRRLVFVALHQDLYNADWLVHETPAGASSTEMNAVLDSLGCAVKSG